MASRKSAISVEEVETYSPTVGAIDVQNPRNVGFISKMGTEVRTRLKSMPVSYNQWLVYLIFFTTSMIQSILAAPWMKLLESSVCRDYYQQKSPGIYPPGVQVPERACKLSEIQTIFASFVSITNMEKQIIELLMLLPLGYLADRKGCKTVLLLNLVCNAAYWMLNVVIGVYGNVVPLWFFYISPTLLFFGGESRVVSAMVFAMISKTVPSTERTVAFSTMDGISCFGKLLGAVLGPSLLSAHISAPFTLAIGCFIVVCIPTCLLSSTEFHEFGEHANAAIVDETDEVTRPLLNDNRKQNIGDVEGSVPTAQMNVTWIDFARSLVHSGDKTALICVVALTLVSVAKKSYDFLLPYISRRFSWTIAEAGYLLTIQAFLLALLYLLIIPAITYLMMRIWGMSRARRDARFTQLSLVSFTVGTFLVGIGPHVAITILGLMLYSLGFGASVGLKSIASIGIENRQVGMLMTAIYLIEALVVVIALPFMAWSYSWATSHGQSLVGLPFLLATAIFLIPLLLTSFIKINR